MTIIKVRSSIAQGRY